MNLSNSIRQASRTLLSATNMKSTDHLIVCFDSDDWGVRKCSSVEQKSELIGKGFSMDNEAFCSHDALENLEDVQTLSAFLKSFSDQYGNHPIFTLNFSMFNPDFQKIIASAFLEYYSSPFYVEYGKEKDKIFECFRRDFNKVFDFQLHGSEHINVLRFLNDARNGLGYAKESANANLTCVGNCYSKGNHFGYMDELNTGRQATAVDFCFSRLREASSLFEKIFNEKPIFLTPSCGVLPKEIRNKLPGIGFRYVKTSEHYFETGKNYRLSRKLLLRKEKGGIVYIVRNCDFEPTITKRALDLAKDDVDFCAKFRKPCIISTHRINFVSGMGESFRSSGLETLGLLLRYILGKYPDAEFCSTKVCIEKYMI